MNPFYGPLKFREFAKYHALGNDYIVLDQQSVPDLCADDVVALCDRHHGVGADGVLLRVPSDRADVGLRIYNPDGSAAEKSGNGLRMFARCLFDLGYTTLTAFTIDTPGGIVEARLVVHRNTVTSVTVDMGQAQFSSVAMHMTGPERSTEQVAVPIDESTLHAACVSMGNPHCVLFVDQLDVRALRRLGPKIESHPLFTRRTNVQMAHVQSRDRIEILIWERGAGETLASGSSSCAVAAAARRADLVNADVDIVMPGGTLKIHVSDTSHITMTGPATPVCRGQLWMP